MKTVLVDNSLCVYSLRDDANSEDICDYIGALAEAGVQYVEMDFRAAMRLRHLPSGIGYIFRPVDPMFLKLAELFDFNYILLTTADINKNIKTDVPIMLECPLSEDFSPRILDCAQNGIDGNITYFRLRGNFPMADYESVAGWVNVLRGNIIQSVDICPLNEKRTALDSAVKFTASGAESLTLTMGLPKKYCSLEEYCFTLMSVFGVMPDNIKFGPLCRASICQQLIFRNNVSAIPFLADLLDRDIHSLYNVDTGEKVRIAAQLKDSEYIRNTFVSALERMAENQGMSEELYKCISTAIRHFDNGFYNDELLHKKYRGIPN